MSAISILLNTEASKYGFPLIDLNQDASILLILIFTILPI